MWVLGKGVTNGKIRAKVKSQARKIKEEAKEEVFLNVPNSITLVRVFLTFVFIYMLFNDYSRLSLTVIFAVAAFSDWLDGFFARKLKQTTKIGARMDQIIDRVFTIMIVGALVFLALKGGMEKNTITFLVLICSREILATPGFVIRLIRNKDPYQVKYIGKVTTFIQCFALGAIILGVSWSIWLVIPTCIVGIVAAIDYLRDSLS